MTTSGRLLKTGMTALAVTIAFAVFVYWAAERVTSGCATGSAAVTKVIPQIAVGTFDNGMTKYTTIIQVINTSGSAASISGNFYTEGGAPLRNVSLSAGVTAITNGALDSKTLDKDGSFVITATGTGAGGSIGWGKISSCSGVSISAVFELRGVASNVLYSRVGVAASPPNMSRFVVPRIRDAAAGLDVAFALVNTGDAGTSASLTATLMDSTGHIVSGPRTITMPGGSHQAVFVQEFFGLTNEAADERTYQYVQFNSASPSFAALALAFEGGMQTSMPVDQLQ